MGNDKWQRRASKLFCVAVALGATYLLLKYALGAILPFALAFLIALPLALLARISQKHLGGSRRAWAFFYASVFWLIAAVALALFLKKLYFDGVELLNYLSDNADAIGQSVQELLERAKAAITQIFNIDESGGEAFARIGAYISDLLVKSVGALGSLISRSFGRAALNTPRAFAGMLVLIVSSFYFCADMDSIRAFVLSKLESRGAAKRTVEKTLRALKAYAKAYAILYCIMFSIVFVAFIIMKIKYALPLAAFFALFDVLPLLSAAFVFVPWGIIYILHGYVALGVGMIILAVLMSITKQIAEPRLVGKGLGLHPLVSVAAMYAGLCLLGFWGMIVAPIALFVIKESC